MYPQPLVSALTTYRRGERPAAYRPAASTHRSSRRRPVAKAADPARSRPGERGHYLDQWTGDHGTSGALAATASVTCRGSTPSHRASGGAARSCTRGRMTTGWPCSCWDFKAALREPGSLRSSTPSASRCGRTTAMTHRARRSCRAERRQRATGGPRRVTGRRDRRKLVGPRASTRGSGCRRRPCTRSSASEPGIRDRPDDATAGRIAVAGLCWDSGLLGPMGQIRPSFAAFAGHCAPGSRSRPGDWTSDVAPAAPPPSPPSPADTAGGGRGAQSTAICASAIDPIGGHDDDRAAFRGRVAQLARPLPGYGARCVRGAHGGPTMPAQRPAGARSFPGRRPPSGRAALARCRCACPGAAWG